MEKQEVKDTLQSMDPAEFEKLVAKLWEQAGWTTRVTDSGRDRGIDVIATRDDPVRQKHVIQVKRYSEKKVGVPEVRQYASLLQQEKDVDAVVIITSSGFTSPAKKQADDFNVKTVSFEDLFEIIDDNQSFELLEAIQENKRDSRTTSQGNNLQVESKISTEEKKYRIKEMLKIHKTNRKASPVNLYFVSDAMPIHNRPYYQIQLNMHCLLIGDEDMGEEATKIAKRKRMEVETFEQTNLKTLLLKKEELPIEFYTDFHIGVIESLLKNVYNASISEIVDVEIDVSGGPISWTEIEDE